MLVELSTDELQVVVAALGRITVTAGDYDTFPLYKRLHHKLTPIGQHKADIIADSLHFTSPHTSRTTKRSNKARFPTSPIS